MEDYKILNNVDKNILVYDEPYIKTPFRDNMRLTFADYTASGRPSPYIEEWIKKNIYPYYSNTHSNASCGIMMKNYISQTKKYIYESLQLTKDQKIIFTGNGTTGSINHMVNLLDFKKYANVTIFLSVYEHYSNYLPWVEFTKSNSNCKIQYIPINENDDIDLIWLDNELANIKKSNPNNYLNIISITGCSNVTGIITPIDKVSEIVAKYNTNNNNKQNLLFVDYACCAPYMKINGKLTDAFFLSPHKFIGGVSTPGILVVDKSLFMNKKPYAPGGGCVKKANCSIIQYEDDLEKKESGGTPNIIGIIKIKKILEMRDKYFDIIHNNDKIIVKYVHSKLTLLSNKYKNLQIIFLNKSLDHRLPIIALSINNLHYNFIVVLLNDIFGIQTRGGISCCGIFGDLIKKKYNIDGWCRITFHWLMTKDEINYILNAIKFVTKYGMFFLNMYDYDAAKNLFTYKNIKAYNIDPLVLAANIDARFNK